MSQDVKKFPSEQQERFIIRLPDGMRDRIKEAARRSGRSMNAEIVAALETFYPEEPTVEELLDRVHAAIEQSKHTDNVPYRKLLVQALEEFSDRVSSGLEFDQYRAPHIGEPYKNSADWMLRAKRWRRVQETGVEQADLERELKRGLLHKAPGDMVRRALLLLRRGDAARALRLFRLQEVKFADPNAAIRAIQADLETFYQENWGDIDNPPWDKDADE